MFLVTRDQGFHMTFENGYTISVQWGPGNYCDNHMRPFDYDEDRNGHMRQRANMQSNTAEVAAWDALGNYVKLGDMDDVKGWLNADEVASLITIIKAMPKGQDNEQETTA